MIKHAKRNEIDDAKWNSCIENDPLHLPYALSYYLDVVAPNWQALILNDYEAVLPLPVKTKYFVSYAYMPTYAPQIGIFSKNKIDHTTYKTFCKAIPKNIQLIDFGVHQNMINVKGNGELSEKPNYILPLNVPYETIKKGYKYNTRQAIKKTLEKNINIKDEADTIAIAKLISQNSKSTDFGEVEFNLTTTIINALKDKDLGFAYSVYSQNNDLEAVVFYIKFKNRIVNLLNASTSQAKKNGYMMVLIDHLIKQNSNSSFILDFEGSSIEGVARFFKSFGANNQPYFHWKWNRLPAIINWLKQ